MVSKPGPLSVAITPMLSVDPVGFALGLAAPLGALSAMASAGTTTSDSKATRCHLRIEIPPLPSKDPAGRVGESYYGLHEFATRWARVER